MSLIENRLNKYQIRYTIELYIMAFSLYFIMLDSGGALGLRNIGFVFILMCFLKSFFLQSIKPKFFYFISLISLFILSYCIFVSYYNNIEFESIIDKLAVFIFIPIFIFAISAIDSKILTKSLVYSGFLFSLTMYITFILIYIMPFEIPVVFENLKIPGWFYIREDGYPQVYYQATLTLVPIAIYSYLNGFKKITYFLLLALLMCLSRFGFFVVLLFIFFSKIFSSSKLSNFVIFLFIFISFAFPIACFIIYSYVDVNDLQYAWNNEDSMGIRLGHLYSIVNNFNNVNFFFGSGAGSKFYSLGFHDYTDNIEVSQLEVIRRYGLIGYFLVNVLILMVFLKLHKDRKFISVFCLFSFYFVAFSNPVLLTLSLSIFVGGFLNDRKDD